jgi:triphosphatase
MPEEIELKLAVDPRDISRLRHSAILRASSVIHTPRTRLTSIYYDTPSSSLQGSAVVLRVRKSGRERIQSVEINAAGSKKHIRHIELESPIRSDRPDLSEVEDSGVRRLIEERRGDEDLKPVFTTNVVRETWRLRFGRSQIECAIDTGSVAANAKRAPISEVELLLKSGGVAGLFQLAHRLNAIVPLRIVPASKAHRGYDLAKGAATAAPVHLDPDGSVRDSFAIIAQACLVHVLSNADYAYRSGDPEGIHQLRVGIRRMRAAFSLFRDAVAKTDRFPIADELRALQQKLGAAREWDVLAEETIARMPKELRKSSNNLIEIAQVKRAEGHRGAHAALRDPHCTGLLLRLEFWVDRQRISQAPHAREREEEAGLSAAPITCFASQVLSAQNARVRKFGKRICELGAEELHRLRIRIKKLRYATEFFRHVWPGRRTERYLSALKEVQQVLGTLHDEIVAQKLVAELAASGALDAAVGGLVDRWLAECQQRDLGHAIALWRKFADRKFFWDGK